MTEKEDSVIDGIGRAAPPRVAAQAEPQSVAAEAPAKAAAAKAPQEPANSSLSRIAKELAKAPPVDSAKVERLRTAIASGDYKSDPAKIAAAMIAQETLPTKE